MRIITFKPKNKKFEVKTYSPYLNQIQEEDYEQNNFVIDNVDFGSVSNSTD